MSMGQSENLSPQQEWNPWPPKHRDRAIAQCSGGHGFNFCWGLKICLCPMLMSCWSVHFGIINPFTPMLVLTGRDEPWPFFQFWRHHFWPKLASSMLNFCRKRRSFQWCPDQSDRPNEAWDMHKNAQKVERKTQTKISCHYTSVAGPW